MTERDRRFLLYIQESIALIHEYTSSGRTAFFESTMVRDAVLRRLETLADAAGKLSPSIHERHPHIPWREVYGFRNIAAHAYLDIDYERVWEIVEHYLSPLQRVMEEELREQ